jgi:PAS domain S-box-containing protein
MGQIAPELPVESLATRVTGAPTAVLVADASARVLAASKPACELLGWRRMELLMLSLAEVGVSQPAFARICAEAEEQGLAVGAARLRDRKGRSIPVRYHVTRIDLVDGPIYHWIAQPRQAPERPTSLPGPDRRRNARALRLTGRELEILQLIADGLGNRDIAQQLSVSLETVKTHIRRVLGKLEARSRAHAVAVAWRKDLVD